MPEEKIRTDDQGRKWEKIPGGEREIRDGYSTSSDLPGGTVIPSHRGKYGAQHGQDPTALMPIHVDPHLNNDSLQIDTGKVTPAMTEAAAAMTTDLTERNQIVADMVAGKREVPVTKPRPKQPKPDSGYRHKPKPKVKIGKPQPMPVPEALTSEDLTDAAEELSEGKVYELLRQLMTNGTFGKMLAAKDTEESKETSNDVQPPKVQVGITSAGGESVSHYHHVLRSDMFLITIYDTRFQFGSRYYPTPSEDTPYRVTVTEPGSQPDEFSAYYTGIRYEFGDHEHSIFVIDSGQPPGTE